MDFSYPCLALYQYIKSFFSLPFSKTWKLLSLSNLHSPLEALPFPSAFRVPPSVHLSIFIVSIYLKVYSPVSFPEIPRIYTTYISIPVSPTGFLFFRFSFKIRSHGRITRNPTTLWPVDGSTELLLARPSAD